MESIVKQPLSRNLWAIMKEFNVLPTEQRFKDLDDYQIEFIIGNMNRDVYEHNKQLKQAQKGGKYDSQFEDDDSSWWDESHEDFDPVPDFLDADDLAKQMEAKLSDRDKEERAKRNDAELNDETEGLTTQHLAMMEYIRRKQEELDEEVGNGKTSEEDATISQESVNKALEDLDDDWYM